MSEAKDLDFLLAIIKQFFRQSSIKRTLAAIDEDGTTGWEKWLQIEFASFVRQHEDVKAWSRERRYRLDQRLTKNKVTCAVDFIIHQKHKQSHMAMELKQVRSMTACVKAMVKDLKKLDGITGSAYDIRSAWCLGVHECVPVEKVQAKAIYFATLGGVTLKQSHIFSERIGRTNYSFTIF